MHIYAIGDLHFSGVPETKPMTVFGEHWQHHRQRIMENWKQTVAPEDLVILCLLVDRSFQNETGDRKRLLLSAK